MNLLTLKERLTGWKHALPMDLCSPQPDSLAPRTLIPE